MTGRAHVVVRVPRDAFARRFGADAGALPRNVCLVGWSAEVDEWFATPESVGDEREWRLRVTPTLRFLDDLVRPELKPGSFWFPFCFHDGWRERIAWTDRYRWVAPEGASAMREWRGAPGELPRFSDSHPWVACYCAHRGDPSAFLIPEAHWLTRGHYRDLFAAVARESKPWSERRMRAIYAGGDHGEVANYLAPAPPGREHPRRHLRAVVDAASLPADVHLGGDFPRGRQMEFRWILDVDGQVRTWDAWAWKMASGSTVLSPASPWESFFTRDFEAWTHYVPVANDFSDLAERLAWCRDNDDACRRIAEAARERAREVYEPERAGGEVARALRERLLRGEGADASRESPGCSPTCRSRRRD